VDNNNQCGQTGFGIFVERAEFRPQNLETSHSTVRPTALLIQY